MNNTTKCKQAVAFPLFVGVDVAGGENTWLACISEDDQRICLEQPPCRASLHEIVQLAEQRDVVAVAIDAQLSMAISDENGFRSSDMELRRLLPEEFRCWVASINSLMAVPIRARILAEAISPSVATILETHPRASLYFASTPDMDDALRHYKNGPGTADHVTRLWKAWCAKFGVQGPLGCLSGGALDAAVCATVAYLMHHRRASLLRLRHTANEKTGRGPFFVVTPELCQSSRGT